jgi:hypothetical protein
MGWKSYDQGGIIPADHSFIDIPVLFNPYSARKALDSSC